MTDRKSLLWAAALALPLIGFGASWFSTHRAAQQGEEWLIPVRGYDPRDLLRGHYIQYRYDWPVEKVANPPAGEGAMEAAMEAATEDNPLRFASAICIEGKAPNMTRASEGDAPNAPESGQPKRVCAITARATLGTRTEVRGLDSGILYIAQTRAPALERKLADPKLQGMIRVRIREDGVMRPVAMEFRTRPAAAASPPRRQ